MTIYRLAYQYPFEIHVYENVKEGTKGIQYQCVAEYERTLKVITHIKLQISTINNKTKKVKLRTKLRKKIQSAENIKMKYIEYFI